VPDGVVAPEPRRELLERREPVRGAEHRAAMLGGGEERRRDRTGARAADALEREPLRELDARGRVDDAARDAALHDHVAVARRRGRGDRIGVRGAHGYLPRMAGASHARADRRWPGGGTIREMSRMNHARRPLLLVSWISERCAEHEKRPESVFERRSRWSSLPDWWRCPARWPLRRAPGAAGRIARPAPSRSARPRPRTALLCPRSRRPPCGAAGRGPGFRRRVFAGARGAGRCHPRTASLPPASELIVSSAGVVRSITEVRR
jgi:hypothetical protein